MGVMHLHRLLSCLIRSERGARSGSHHCRAALVISHVMYQTMRIHGIAGTALGTGLQRLVALVGEVEGGRITLAALHMEHPLLGLTALQQQVQSHYLRAALPELVKLVGSASVLGGAQLSHGHDVASESWPEPKVDAHGLQLCGSTVLILETDWGSTHLLHGEHGTLLQQCPA